MTYKVETMILKSQNYDRNYYEIKSKLWDWKAKLCRTIITWKSKQR